MSIFDGLSGLLADTFGGPVEHFVSGSSTPVLITGVFRNRPIAVPDDEGREVLVEVPMLKVRQPVAATIARGDRIVPANGKTYRVVTDHDSGSPAEDAFVNFALELL